MKHSSAIQASFPTNTIDVNAHEKHATHATDTADASDTTARTQSHRDGVHSSVASVAFFTSVASRPLRALRWIETCRLQSAVAVARRCFARRRPTVELIAAAFYHDITDTTERGEAVDLWRSGDRKLLDWFWRGDDRTRAVISVATVATLHPLHFTARELPAFYHYHELHDDEALHRSTLIITEYCQRPRTRYLPSYVW